jgi:hypothetical protein
MNADIRESFAAAVGGRERLAQNFAALTMRSLEGRADRELEDAADTVAGAYRVIDKVAARLKFDDAAAIEELKAEWLGRFRSAWAAFQHAGARVANWMVTGPSNFPVERNRKRMDTEHRRLGEMLEVANGVGAWAEKRIRRIQRDRLGPIGCADHELESARRKLAGRECRQSMMRAVNAAIRKHRTKADAIARISAELAAQGCQVEAALIPELLKPDCCGRIGFADYQLSNNNAEIRRLRGRVAVLERRAAAVHAAAEDPAEDPSDNVDGIRIVENALEQRLQIFFPDKPDARIRDQLKSRGFRWAPSSGAWQRQLTGNAIAAARAIVACPASADGS